MAKTKQNKVERTPDAQMELVEHLAELRSRLFRSIGYLILGMILTYNLFHEIYALFSYPLQPILAHFDSKMLFTNIADPFILRMQVCFIAGITVAFPFITLEIWGFVAPALTEEERKPVKFLAPFSVLLFLAGVATAYAALPACYAWMAQYATDVPNAAIYQEPRTYILLTAKIMLAFGISFELPVVLLFLARIGIITAELMTTYWKQAVIVIFVAAMILTPSNDPLTMTMMAVPMAGLYVLSIGLVKAFEPKEGQDGAPISALITISLAPVAIIAAAGFWLWRSHAFTHIDTTAPRPQQLQNQITANQQQAQKTQDDLQAKLTQILTRMDTLEKENAELRDKIAELKPSPAPSVGTIQKNAHP